MRVLLSCLQSPCRHPIAAYGFWEVYFKRGVEEAGHAWLDVADVDWAGLLARANEQEATHCRQRAWSKTIDTVRSELRGGRPVDVFLSYLYPEMIDPSAVNEIRRMGIPCVNFFCDNVRLYGEVPANFGCFDLHWVPEFEALPMYQQAHLRAVHAPMPCWVDPAYRSPVQEESPDVTFIGSHDTLRRFVIGSAIELGADIQIAGTGWRSEADDDPPVCRKGLRRFLRNQFEFFQRHGAVSTARKIVQHFRPLPRPPISDDRLLGKIDDADYARSTRHSLITLGVNRVQTLRHLLQYAPTYSRLRDIEAPMMGACYLTEWTEGLSRFYEVGHEIETYRTPEEMADKIKELARSPLKRRELRRAGQRRACEDLSISKSLGRVFESLGLSSSVTGPIKEATGTRLSHAMTE